MLLLQNKYVGVEIVAEELRSRRKSKLFGLLQAGDIKEMSRCHGVHSQQYGAIIVDGKVLQLSVFGG